MLSKFLSCVVLFFSFQLTTPSHAQQESLLSGTLQTESGEAVAFANVVLIKNSDQSLITGVVSDESGKFALKTTYTGEAILKVSAIGFDTFQSETMKLTSGSQKDFGVLQVKESAELLNEVTVSSTRPEVTIKADRTVVNVEGTVMAEGNNALDVIGRSPGVFVDGDGNIKLNGRAGVIVMIDERPTYMSAADLANFLRAMPADNLKSIEVINNPGSQFDAEGAGGVINIVLKKNTLNGMNGSAFVGGQYNGLYSSNAGASLNIKNNKWTYTTSLNAGQNNVFNDLNITRNFQQSEGVASFNQATRLDENRSNVIANGGLDYQINDQHSVGTNVSWANFDNGVDAISNTTISNPNTTDINRISSLNDNQQDNNRLFANFHYVGKLDTMGARLTSDIDVAKMRVSSNGILANSYWVNEDFANADRDDIRTINDMDYRILTAKVDFSKPLAKGKSFAAGVKGSWINSDNNLDLSRRTPNEPWIADPNSNRFIYTENVLAAYSNYNTNWGEKVSAQLGLRAEYSDITGESITLNQLNRQQYVSLFPSVFVQQQITPDYKIIYNVNRRITRPNYRSLNPYVFYIDPLTTEEGNPNLRPMFSSNFEVTQVFKNSYQVTLRYSRTTDIFNQVMYQDEETKTSRLRMANLDNASFYNINFMIPVDITKWWGVSNYIETFHSRFQSQIGEDLLEVSQTSFNIRSQHNINLPKGFKVELMGMYVGPFQDGQLAISGFGWVDLGLNKSFADGKYSIAVNATDLFRTQKIRGAVDFEQIDTSFRQYRSQQGVRVTLRYRFNKGEKFNVNSRSGSDEERSRLN